MSKEIKIEISIEGESIYRFTKLSIQQEFNAHHTFELILDHDVVEQTGSHTLQASKDLIGRFITFCFGEKEPQDHIFKGIITHVSLRQQQGLWGSLVLKGHSPTYLLESGAHYTSYYKRKLKDILKEASSGLAANDMELSFNPKYASEIAYMCQYGESNFDFINRLSAEYGEWFFYDGRTLYFGKPSNQEKLDLIYGEHLESMEFSLKLAPGNVKHYSYNSKDDALITAALPGSISGIDDYTKKALQAADFLYRKPVSQPVPIRTASKVELDSYAEIHKGKIASGMVLLQGQGDLPKLKLGVIANLKVSQKGIGVGENEHGDYLITKVCHYIEGTGSYTNIFEGIPAGNKVMPFEVQKPLADTQIATVKDNSDPDGLGRVRVQMLWQKEKGLLTDWIRVMTPDAGGSDQVSTNRGFVFIPEVGDQVMVGFRYADANRPFVLGSLFHGKVGGGGGSGNNNKSLTTKSGSTVTLNEGAGSILVKDAAGNKVSIDGAGNIMVKSSESIVLSCGPSKVELKKDGTLNINGKNILTNGTDSIKVDTKEHNVIATNNTISGKNHITGGDTKIDGGNVFIN